MSRGDRSGEATDAERHTATWRTFVGLPVPAAIRAQLERRLEPVRASGAAARWVPTANLHLTLCFLGATRPAAIESVAREVRDVAAGVSPIPLRLGSVGTFRAGPRGRVLWLAVLEDDGALTALGNELRERLGVEPDPPLRLHLTLARDASSEAIEGARRVLDDTQGSWVCRAIHLYRSRPGTGPPRYESLARTPLGGPTGDGTIGRASRDAAGTRA